MGVVMAWIRVLIGFVILALAYTVFSPIIDFFVAVCITFGGNAASTASMIDIIVNKIMPVGISLSLLIYGFLESTRSEDNSR